MALSQCTLQPLERCKQLPILHVEARVKNSKDNVIVRTDLVPFPASGPQVQCATEANSDRRSETMSVNGS